MGKSWTLIGSCKDDIHAYNDVEVETDLLAYICSCDSAITA